MNWDHIQVLGFQVITVLTLAMPALEKIAELTSNKVDNEIVDFLAKVLSYVPRLRQGDKK